MNQEMDEKLRENGQIVLENNKEERHILLLGKLRGMRRLRIKIRRPNMIMYCRDWLLLKMMIRWKGFWYF